MKTRNLIAILAGMAAVSLFADNVTIQDTPYDGNPIIAGPTNGGEFKATIASTNYSFITFCLERNEFVSLPGTYNYTLDSFADAGGLGGGSPDTLSVGAAWLYRGFLNGAIGGYYANHDVNAGLLQQAFWMLEDELAWDSSNPYISWVLLNFSSSQANAQASATTAQLAYYGVSVMNLTSGRDPVTKHQSMLYGVPDNGVTAVLLGLALLGLAAFRRRY